jgi:hypothetical protein
LIFIEGYLPLLKRLIMKKLALLASVAIITAGSVGSAEAQRWRGYRGGWNGGAVAAGLVGGAVLGGLITAAARPAYGYGYGYPGYGYYPSSYPAYGSQYGYGYGYSPAYSPAYSYPAYGYYSAPATQVVYEPAPVYRTRVVYRQPRVVNRVVYAEPRYRTRVVYRQPRAVTRVVYRDRAPIVRSVRRDVLTTGAIGERRVRQIRRIDSYR